MPEKSQKRKLRSDQGTSQEEIENCNASNDENVSLSEQDFEDISNKIENRLSKRLRDTEFGQREILRLIENLASKVDNLSNSVSEQCSSAAHFELETDPIGNTGNESIDRNVSSNKHVLNFNATAFVYSKKRDRKNLALLFARTNLPTYIFRGDANQAFLSAIQKLIIYLIGVLSRRKCKKLKLTKYQQSNYLPPTTVYNLIIG